MSYKIKKNTSDHNGRKKWLIIHKQTGKIVGSSSAKEKAKRSIKHREEAED